MAKDTGKEKRTRKEILEEWDRLKELARDNDCELIYCAFCGTPMVLRLEEARFIMSHPNSTISEFFKCCKAPFLLWLVVPFTPRTLPEFILGVENYLKDYATFKLLFKIDTWR